jgi:hypothetical protein
MVVDSAIENFEGWKASVAALSIGRPRALKKSAGIGYKAQANCVRVVLYCSCSRLHPRSFLEFFGQPSQTHRARPCDKHSRRLKLHQRRLPKIANYDPCYESVAYCTRK